MYNFCKYEDVVSPLSLSLATELQKPTEFMRNCLFSFHDLWDGFLCALVILTIWVDIEMIIVYVSD